MVYKNAFITLTFRLSSSEQYQPSEVTFFYDGLFGPDGFLEPLTDANRLKFLGLARDELTRQFEKELVAQGCESIRKGS